MPTVMQPVVEAGELVLAKASTATTSAERMAKQTVGMEETRRSPADWLEERVEDMGRQREDKEVAVPMVLAAVGAMVEAGGTTSILQTGSPEEVLQASYWMMSW